MLGILVRLLTIVDRDLYEGFAVIDWEPHRHLEIYKAAVGVLFHPYYAAS